MTIISSSTSAHVSPKQHLLDSIASQAGAGKISSADQTALDTAVEDIDASLTSDRSSTSTGTRLDPSQVKSRIDDLIAGEVTKGTLTSDHATTLKQILSQGGAGGHGGPGGPPPGPPPAQGGATDGSSLLDGTTSDDGTASATSSASTSGACDLLASFVKQLQASQNQTSGYAANGQTGSSRLASALLLNFEA